MAIKAVSDHRAHDPGARAVGHQAQVQARPAHVGLLYKAVASDGSATPFAILALQRAAGAAAETPGKSVNEYGGLILDLLDKDRERKRWIQEVVCEAAESTPSGLASRTNADAGQPGRGSAIGKKPAYVLSNRSYRSPLGELRNSEGRRQNEGCV